MPEIKLVKVSKRYGRIIANDNINLTIKNGEYVSIIGPSGCGKTTLIKNIAGIIKPDKGKILIDNIVVNDFPIEDREIGYVFQDIALFPHMSVWENITYAPTVKGISKYEIKPIAIEMLELIKLEARSEAFPYELSGGTQQKTAVARALISRARLLLFDEPLGALDIKVRTVLRYELRRLVKDLKLTALHVTHDQEEAMSISDRVIVMKSGRIIEHGSPMELYTSPKKIFTANFVGEANFLTGVIKQKQNGDIYFDGGNGIQLIIKNKEIKLGERAVVAFRPQFVTFVEKEELNSIRGNIIEILYSGNFIRIKIKLVNDSVIVVKTSLKNEKIKYKVDDNVEMTVPPDNIFVYKYPKKGLSKELALE